MCKFETIFPHTTPPPAVRRLGSVGNEYRAVLGEGREGWAGMGRDGPRDVSGEESSSQEMSEGLEIKSRQLWPWRALGEEVNLLDVPSGIQR